MSGLGQEISSATYVCPNSQVRRFRGPRPRPQVLPGGQAPAVRTGEQVICRQVSYANDPANSLICAIQAGGHQHCGSLSLRQRILQVRAPVKGQGQKLYSKWAKAVFIQLCLSAGLYLDRGRADLRHDGAEESPPRAN